ncbi:hypothetical protein DFH27DRAFT_529647 [Peziza echinospora]|nr:hypothetical protein DFH27DRAFT_529647 [Peziza echinospora]
MDRNSPGQEEVGQSRDAGGTGTSRSGRVNPNTPQITGNVLLVALEPLQLPPPAMLMSAPAYLNVRSESPSIPSSNTPPPPDYTPTVGLSLGPNGRIDTHPNFVPFRGQFPPAYSVLPDPPQNPAVVPREQFEEDFIETIPGKPAHGFECGGSEEEGICNCCTCGAAQEENACTCAAFRRPRTRIQRTRAWLHQRQTQFIQLFKKIQSSSPPPEEPAESRITKLRKRAGTLATSTKQNILNATKKLQKPSLESIRKRLPRTRILVLIAVVLMLFALIIGGTFFSIKHSYSRSTEDGSGQILAVTYNPDPEDPNAYDRYRIAQLEADAKRERQRQENIALLNFLGSLGKMVGSSGKKDESSNWW